MNRSILARPESPREDQTLMLYEIAHHFALLFFAREKIRLQGHLT